jgi:hypothetical protein
VIVHLLHLAAKRSPIGWVRATATNGVQRDPTASNRKALTSVCAVSAGQGPIGGNVDTEVVLQLPPTALNGVKPQVSDVETVTSLPRPLP